ncbi:glycosyltransferase family 4 protein [Silicimonas algicola]|uniref:Glycosyltransferase involved in cell wall biosynthesis n=1 Tax=Silicimonas algicola TaxID=1826607 RepID=A0A316FXQ2_9RHOB|nr:glycosyltransferase [Silicimonas algicola]AZQ66754.1 glycosyltransferase family 4 protein [Silicimonas algicola]PWK53132.1 glycosyltransferase involved in cell wall biosynthesis [Silicimonas algicola]
MRIALTVDPEIPVPPVSYGGIERIVDMLAQSLVARGHEVTLFAHAKSICPVELVGWRGASSVSKLDSIRNCATLAPKVFAGRFDLVHSFSRLAYLTPLLPLPIPKLMTYQRAITSKSVWFGHKLARGTLEFSAISEWMVEGIKHIGKWHFVPNGVPLDVYDFRSEIAPDAPLVFLGRIEEIKGPHLAIEIARRTNSKLVIAGNVPAEHKKWYEHHVAPHIDGAQITYVGPVNDAQKNELLGRARALLMPILWEEPFGIVMTEAMACGTPVIGTRRGAVPEVVKDGVTGFVGETVDELVEALARLPTLDRACCRREVEVRYSNDAVVEAYLAIYRALLAKRVSGGGR